MGQLTNERAGYWILQRSLRAMLKHLGMYQYCLQGEDIQYEKYLPLPEICILATAQQQHSQLPSSTRSTHTTSNESLHTFPDFKLVKVSDFSTDAGVRKRMQRGRRQASSECLLSNAVTENPAWCHPQYQEKKSNTGCYYTPSWQQ